MRNGILFILCLLLPVSVLAGFNVTTLQELEQDVKNNLATEADPFHPDTVLDDFINLACRDLASYGVIVRADSVILATSGASFHIQSLSDDALEVLAVFPCTSAASRALDRIRFEDWGKIGASSDLSAIKYYAVQPSHVTDSSTGLAPPSGAKLWLYPGPGSVDTLVVIYTAQAVELAGDADTTNIPYSYRELIVYHATALSFARAQEYDKAAWWFSLYDQQLKQKLLFRKYQFDYIILPKEITK